MSNCLHPGKSDGASAVGTGIGFILVALLFSGAIWFQHDLIRDYQHLVQTDVQQAKQISEANTLFKIQVQEWKNVLLRGADASNREKYWKAFQQVEADVQKRATVLVEELADGLAKNKVNAFLSAHKTMATAYRKGFDQFVQSNFDHRAGDAAVKGIDREPASCYRNLAISSMPTAKHF